MKKLLLLTLIVIIFASCATPPHAQNRERFGKSALPIWMPLSAVERDTVVAAKKGLTEELKLTLAILFTSRSFDKERIALAQKKYDEFIVFATEQLKPITNPEERAEKLYALFFERFVKNEPQNNEQSQGVLGVLLNRVFDINSAAILFAITAEHFGFLSKILVTKGDKNTITSDKTNLSLDVLSGDIYLQLEENGLSTPIIIKPIWKNGFNIQPDAPYFVQLIKNNPTKKTTPAVELERYKERKTFSLFDALMLEYKIDKGYEIVDLEFGKSIRRNEMAAQLTDSCEVLIDRAWGWRNIYASYSIDWNAGEILPFIELIQNELNRTTKLCNKEKRFIKIAGILHLYAAKEYALNNRGIELRDEIKQAVTYLDTQDKAYENNRRILINAVHFYLKKVVESGDLQKDVAIINAIISSIPDKKLQFEVAAAFYFHAGQFFFKKSEFIDSADFYNRCAKMGESHYLKVCENNAAISYLNRAAFALNSNKCTTAKKSVKQCNERYPTSEVCKKAEKMVNENCK